MSRMYAVQLDSLPEKVLHAKTREDAVIQYLSQMMDQLREARYQRDKRKQLNVKARKLEGLYI
jgi:hypothetical protein